MKRIIQTLGVILALTVIFAPADLYADDSREIFVKSPSGSSGLTIWALLSHHRVGGAGLGVHFMTPVSDGFLTDLNIEDYLFLEFGVDAVGHFYHYSKYSERYLRLRPSIGILWTIWLIDELAVYPKIDVGYNLYFGRSGWWLPYPTGSAGILYRLDNFELRAEGGWYGANVGLLFRF